jgi:hypothetical protein
MNAGLRVGAVLELADDDYRYGTGRLAIRLTEVTVDPRLLPATEEWVEVQGIAMYPAAEAAQPRYVAIRVSAIPGALRKPGWRPPHYPAPRLRS